MFISYRREDASGFAGRLHEALSRHFGDERVFRDVDKIRPGAPFGEVIHESLESCGAFVVVIGRERLVDARGRRRVDDPDDWVRHKIIRPVLFQSPGFRRVIQVPKLLATYQDSCRGIRALLIHPDKF